MTDAWNPTREELEEAKREIAQMENSLAIEYDHTLEAELTKKRRFYIMDHAWHRTHRPDETI